MFRINPAKKVIVIIVGLTFIYNSFGFILVFQHLIQLTKTNIHSAIENKEIKEEIIFLSFRKSDIEEHKVDFQWKHKKEFKYNNMMYDIVERIETPDSFYFYCYLDSKESKLEKLFNRQFENKNNENRHNSSNRINTFKSLDHYLISEYFFYPQQEELTYLLYFEKEKPLNEPDVPSPPPKQIISS